MLLQEWALFLSSCHQSAMETGRWAEGRGQAQEEGKLVTGCRAECHTRFAGAHACARGGWQLVQHRPGHLVGLCVEAGSLLEPPLIPSTGETSTLNLVSS